MSPLQPPNASRSFQREEWSGKAFYTSVCKFFIDVPLDMSAAVLWAQREAQGAGFQVVPGGLVVATDSIYRGAVLVEIAAPTLAQHISVLYFSGEVYGVSVPPKTRLREEVLALGQYVQSLRREVAVNLFQQERAGATFRSTRILAATRPPQSTSS